ncbi:hypothetical protein ABPG72_018244 [Tetrahymena utriculariae]
MNIFPQNLSKLFVGLSLFVFYVHSTPLWSTKKANNWYQSIGWRVGCNFIPSTAVNQLEMWQAETFDPQTIQNELQLAQNIGFNTVRFFLQYLARGEDKSGFKSRMNTLLNIIKNFKIKTIFVLFDDCQNSDPHIGQQPAPITEGIHNSQWVQCPGSSQPVYSSYKEYIQDILTKFAEDDRVLFWDLLIQRATEVNITQPNTAEMWHLLKQLNFFQVQNSDIITFHLYSQPLVLEIEIKNLKKHGRPIICTEYMARTLGYIFKNQLPIFKKHNLGAINWGLVFGKTQTVFRWRSPEGAPIPKVWFRDIFWKNSTYYSEEECSFIQRITTNNLAKTI